MILLILGSLIATLSACAKTPDSPSWLDAIMNPPTRTVVSASVYPDLFEERPTTRRYTDDSGNTIIETTTSAEDSSLIRVERRLAPEDGSEPEILARRWFSTDPSGAVLLHRSLNPERDIEIVYAPPLVVAPPELRPGEAHESTTTIRSFEGGQTSKPQPGTATYTLELLGERQLNDGVREAHVRSTITISLGRSVVTRRTDRLLLISETDLSTVLHEDTLETVRVFGLTVSTNRRSLASRLDRTDAD